LVCNSFHCPIFIITGFIDWGQDTETEDSESDEESSLTDDENEPLNVPEENAEREIEGDFEYVVSLVVMPY